MAITLDGSTGITTPTYGGSVSAEYITPVTGFKNRIINGDMKIDQRNAGASVSNNVTGTQYSLDRWLIYGNNSSKFTVQRNAGSVTPPAGFSNYLGVTSTAETTVGSGDIYEFIQHIEGFNTADLAWGTANAQTVTLSFWVRSSLTGTFGGALQNSGSTRSYPFSFTISSANTWEYKTITIAGDTTGTWLTNNGTGISLVFSLGMGSTYSSTAGSWQAGLFLSPTGATSVVGTAGATFYITGVQLEKGDTATSFDYRPYGTELALCQRYLPAFVGDNNIVCNGSGFDANNTRLRVSFPVQVRTPATGMVVSSAGHFSILTGNGSLTTCNSLSFSFSGVNGAQIGATHTGGGATNASTALISNNTSSILYFTGCEL